MLADRCGWVLLNRENMQYRILYSVVWLLSKLPLWVLYVISDALFFLVYYVVRYRRIIVRRNLTTAFPEKDSREIRRTEKKFYHFFSDYIVETIKLCTMTEKEMRRRIQFEGVEELVSTLKNAKKDFAFIYVAHYGNWEWVASLSKFVLDIDPSIATGQIYHPLRNPAFDRLFLHIRSRYGAVNIPMKETLRYVVRNSRSHTPTIIGFIADQAPKWNSIHHWVDFLNHNTPVFTGTEQIARKVDAALFYLHLERPRRGRYRCVISKITDDVRSCPENEPTDTYFRLLSETIKARPEIWLWSHDRWKRTYEEYLKRNEKHNSSVQ